jgi:hypothetical protein
VAIAPPGVSDGLHIGPAAITRNSYTLFAQDTWKITPTFTVDYGLRWELYTPITERAKRTGGFLRIDGKQQYLVNPQPGYQTDWKGFAPRIQAAWQATTKLQIHAGGAITIIPPNIWQDNFLTGSTPYAIYPRLIAAQNAPVNYGFTITPSQLPAPYTPSGAKIATNAPKTVPANTVMDVDRYEKDLAALGASDIVSDLNLSGIRRGFANARLYTWTAGFERPIGKLTADVNYVGTASNHLPRISFPNAYPYATPGFAPDTEFNAAGQVIGGLGVENVIDDTAHSTYHALQTSLSGTVPGGGPGVQASYTWGKSIDDTSVVIGGTGLPARSSRASRRIPTTRTRKKARPTSTIPRICPERGPGSARRVDRLPAPGEPQSYAGLGTAQHLVHLQRRALYRLLRSAADRLRLPGRRPARPDRQA